MRPKRVGRKTVASKSRSHRSRKTAKAVRRQGRDYNGLFESRSVKLSCRNDRFLPCRAAKMGGDGRASPRTQDEGRDALLRRHRSDWAGRRRCTDRRVYPRVVALDPNAAQRLYYARAAGTARCAWTWSLAEWQRQKKTSGKPTDVSLRRD
jgi:hypothetical protein